MKQVVVCLTLTLCGISALASVPRHKCCDQFIYDKLYESIIRDSTKHPFIPGTFKERNDGIRLLRQLCRGQRSTYEKPANWAGQ